MASPYPITERQRLRGFTLLEVIVAMAVLAFGIAGVLAAISACLRNTGMAANYSRAALCAQQVAVLLERSTPPLASGTQSGSFIDQSTGPDDSLFADTSPNNTNTPGSAFTWTAVVSAADSQGCYPVQITVTWQSGKQQYQLNTVLLPQSLPPVQQGTSAAGTATSTSTTGSTTGGSTSTGGGRTSTPGGGAS